MPHWKHGVFQLVLIKHVHYITLVFGIVGAARKTKCSLVVFFNTCMMPGCYCIEAKQPSALAETIELEMAIAFDTWVGCKAIHMGLHVWVDNMLVEVVGKVEYQMINAQLLGNSPRIIHVGNRTATGVAFASPQAHSHAHHFVAGVFQFGGSHRRIDATRHGHKHFHALKANDAID